MCGRFTQHHPIEEIIERFEVAEVEYKPEPRYNIAPTNTVAAIVQNHARALVGLQWGLIPFWAKDPKIASQLINARAETLAEKPSFKYALSKRRCLIPVDGFYEWKKQKGGNQHITFVAAMVAYLLSLVCGKNGRRRKAKSEKPVRSSRPSQTN